jgi:hypothetical protein
VTPKVFIHPTVPLNIFNPAVLFPDSISALKI